MDIFKKFLDDVCLDRPYRYERVERLAEIYLSDDVVPIAIVESNHKHEHNVRFRMGLSSINIAKLTQQMTLAESCLQFNEDFFIHETYGYLYGDEARQAFIERLRSNIEAASFNNNTEGAFFVSEEPLFSHGDEPRTKFQQMWDEE
jgi:hypothetical protein